VNDKQREFVTAILKIVFTVIFAGMTGGKLFNLSLAWWHYITGFTVLAVIFIYGFNIQRREG